MSVEGLAAFDPHEYHGVVLNRPQEAIPAALAKEIARVGSLDLWQFQAFTHHDHPYLGSNADNALEGEPQVAREWSAVLAARFPDKRFVIETRPIEMMTWYQATRSAPTEDEEAFEDYTTPVVYNISGKDVAAARQAGGDAGVKALFEAQRASQPKRKGSAGDCEKCRSNLGFTPPKVSTLHRGIRTIRCLACDAELVHSTRTIRDRVGF